MTGVQVVCLSYLNPDSAAHARFAVRRLRRRTDVPIFVGFWTTDPDDVDTAGLAGAVRADLCVTSLTRRLFAAIVALPSGVEG